MTPKTALVIDDDPIYLVVAEECLRNLGLTEVVTAANGALGLKCLADRQTSFDLIICDLQMPDLDGVGVIRELSKLSFRGALIISSSKAADILRTVRAMAQMSGVRVLGTLEKPMRENELKSLLAAEGTMLAAHKDTVITRYALKTSFEDGSLVPFYQPKFDLKRSRLQGVEVLARTFSSDGKPRTAVEHLEAAEREDMTIPLTLHMFRLALEDSRKWMDQGVDLHLAFNISPASLTDLELPDALANLCQAARIDPKSVTLEITENRMIEYNVNILDVLSRFRLIGFRLSLDDFGAGATSIDQLRLYPFNEMKIDKSFIQDAGEDPFSYTTVETSSRLAAMLGLSVVAEGVETEAHLNLVLKLGAETIQGYLISAARPGSDMVDWVKDFRKRGQSVAAICQNAA